MPKKATGVRAGARQKVNVDFYKVSNAAGGPTAFRNALREIIARKGAHRRVLVRGERIDVHSIQENATTIEGEVGRLRSHDIPAISDKECVTRDIPLKENELITERTAFLFDPKTGILAVHAKREAVSASKIADLCDEVGQNKTQFFELQLMLNADSQEKFEKLSLIQRFQVTYTAAATSTIRKPDQTTENILKTLQDIEGKHIKISISSGGKKTSKLNFKAAWALLTKAKSSGEAAVEELRVSGRGAGDEKLVIDLIKDRMRAFKIIDVTGSSASYEQRRIAVRQCYEEQKQTFKA
jgi:hypothetical protein